MVVVMMMVPLIVSHDQAVHKELPNRRQDFAPDVKVDWVRMAQSVLRFNVVIVCMFSNKGSWVSEAWRREHPEELEEEAEGPPERVTTAERREQLGLDHDPLCAVCVRSSGTPLPHGVRLTSAGRGNPNTEDGRTKQPP